MDRMDRSVTYIDTRLTEKAVCNAMAVNETEFISIYHPINNFFDIYQHNSSSSNYTRIDFVTSQQESTTNATNPTTTTTTSKPSSTESRPQGELLFFFFFYRFFSPKA